MGKVAGAAPSSIAATNARHRTCAAAAEPLPFSDFFSTFQRCAPDQQGGARGTAQKGGVPAAAAAAMTVAKRQPHAPVVVKKHPNGVAKRLYCPWAVQAGGSCKKSLLTKADDEPQDGCQPGQVSLMCRPKRMLGDKQAAAKQRTTWRIHGRRDHGVTSFAGTWLQEKSGAM